MSKFLLFWRCVSFVFFAVCMSRLFALFLWCLLITLCFVTMIDDLTRITRYRSQVAGMIHDLTLFSPDRPGMKLKDIASCIGVSVVTCSRAHTGTVSLSYLPFSKLQELYEKEFGKPYTASSVRG